MSETFDQQLARLRAALNDHGNARWSYPWELADATALAELLRRWDAHMVALAERNLEPGAVQEFSRPENIKATLTLSGSATIYNPDPDHIIVKPK